MKILFKMAEINENDLSDIRSRKVKRRIFHQWKRQTTHFYLSVRMTIFLQYLWEKVLKHILLIQYIKNYLSPWSIIDTFQNRAQKMLSGQHSDRYARYNHYKRICFLTNTWLNIHFVLFLGEYLLFPFKDRNLLVPSECPYRSGTPCNHRL